MDSSARQGAQVIDAFHAASYAIIAILGSAALVMAVGAVSEAAKDLWEPRPPLEPPAP